MPTQEEMLQQVYTGESTDPFEYYTKPWRKRYPYDQNMFPSIGLDMGGVPFGGALTGGESPFYLGQGQGDETNILATLAAQMLPKLAQAGMGQLMPTQQTTPNARAVFNVDEGMANLLQPTMFNANAELYGTEPWMTESYPSNFHNSIYDIPSAKAIFNVDEGMPNLPSGGGGGGIGGLLNNNLGGLGGTVGGMIPGLFGYKNPALNQIGGTLGGLGGAALGGTGIFGGAMGETLGNLINPSTGGAANVGGMPGLSLLTNPGAGMSDFSNPYSGYLSSIPMIGQVLGGFLEGILGKEPKGTLISENIYNPNSRGFEQGSFLTNPYLDTGIDYISRQMAEIIQNLQANLANENNVPFYSIPLSPQTENDPSGSAWNKEFQDVLNANGLSDYGSYSKLMNEPELDFYKNSYEPMRAGVEAQSFQSGSITS